MIYYVTYVHETRQRSKIRCYDNRNCVMTKINPTRTKIIHVWEDNKEVIGRKQNCVSEVKVIISKRSCCITDILLTLKFQTAFHCYILNKLIKY
jgi:hypothetical protein